MFYAHSTDNPDRSDWHMLAEHLREVGRLAGMWGRAFGAENAAALAGWLHDLGKYSDAFQRRLGGAIERVDHSTAGAREVRKLAQALPSKDQIAAELIAYAIAGHHAGLADKESESGSLSDRLNEKIMPIEPLDSSWKSEVNAGVSDLFPPGFQLSSERPVTAFQLAFLGRMIFSCLVDADYRDTEAFFARVKGERIDREWEDLTAIADRLRSRFDCHMENVRRGARDTEVNRLRAEILSHVRAKANLPRGVFTLNVPTGGGKTLASLGFALDHAKAHGMRRIVTAIPFTSVIDQTAAIFRDVLGDDVVLEHHSAIDEERLPAWDKRDDQQHQGKNKLRLAMEDWAAPVIATTNVQLFESLFSNRPSRCRKLHNLVDSIIVLDEAQTIPLHVLRPAVAALKELICNYGCSVVLCTATQPALGVGNFKDGFDLKDRELAPDPPELHRRLRRTVLRLGGEMTDSDLVAAVKDTEHVLVIVNSRAHALALYRAVKKADLTGAIHLTTRQTAADRRVILDDIRRRLDPKKPEPCRVIATSLVEAGVDLDFPRAWRAEAGLDQIMQAAGRVNREGRRAVEDSVVTVFKPAEAKAPSEIKGFIGDFSRITGTHGDLFSPQAVHDYFDEVYWRKGEALDKHRIVDAFRLSSPTASGATSFDYRTVAQNFQLIETGMLPVIVAIRDEAKRALDGLRAGRLKPGGAARALQTHIVQVPPRARVRLLDNGHICFVEGFADQFAVLLGEHLYTRDVGLVWEDGDYLSVEGLLV